jgi:predicted Na+-dependent transporter
MEDYHVFIRCCIFFFIYLFYFYVCGGVFGFSNGSQIALIFLRIEENKRVSEF